MAKIERGTDSLFSIKPEPVPNAGAVSDIWTASKPVQPASTALATETARPAAAATETAQPSNAGPINKGGRPRLPDDQRRKKCAMVALSGSEMDTLREWAARRGTRLGTLLRDMSPWQWRHEIDKPLAASHGEARMGDVQKLDTIDPRAIHGTTATARPNHRTLYAATADRSMVALLIVGRCRRAHFLAR